MKITIEATKMVTVEVEEAEVDRVIKSMVNAGWKIDAVGDKDVVGICESCGGPAFSTDQPYDEVFFCDDDLKAAREDAMAEVV